MENKSIFITVALAFIVFSIGFQMGQHHGGGGYASSMQHETMTMDEMTTGLTGKTGDTFDKAFIENMIVHHEGAVAMARLIPAQAKHEELKKLGQDIIAAQTKEIEMMRGWLKDWGYSH